MTMNTTVDVARMVQLEIPADPAMRSRLQERIWETWKNSKSGPLEGMCKACGTFLPTDSKLVLFGGKAIWPGTCEECDPLVDEHYDTVKKVVITEWKTQCPELFQEIILAESGVDWSLPHLDRVINWDPGQPGLYITGDSGRYKTTAIWALFRNLEARHGVVPKLLTSPALARNLSISAKEMDPRFIKDCAETQLLIIDDLGKEKFTEAITSGFYEIIDGRYHSRKPIVITSRYGGEALQRRFEVSQDSNMGFDICRRIGDMVQRVDFK